MQTTFLRLTVLLTTFAIGLCFSYLMHISSGKSDIYRAVEIPQFCEVHGETLKAVLIETACGEFRNSRGEDAGITCNNGEDPGLSAEDALLVFHMAGGHNSRAIWDDLAAARQSSFPHGYGELNKDCSPNNSKCTYRKVCARCRAAESSWMKERSAYLLR